MKYINSSRCHFLTINWKHDKKEKKNVWWVTAKSQHITTLWLQEINLNMKRFLKIKILKILLYFSIFMQLFFPKLSMFSFNYSSSATSTFISPTLHTVQRIRVVIYLTVTQYVNTVRILQLTLNRNKNFTFDIF